MHDDWLDDRFEPTLSTCILDLFIRCFRVGGFPSPVPTWVTWKGSGISYDMEGIVLEMRPRSDELCIVVFEAAKKVGVSTFGDSLNAEAKNVSISTLGHLSSAEAKDVGTWSDYYLLDFQFRECIVLTDENVAHTDDRIVLFQTQLRSPS